MVLSLQNSSSMLSFCTCICNPTTHTYTLYLAPGNHEYVIHISPFQECCIMGQYNMKHFDWHFSLRIIFQVYSGCYTYLIVHCFLVVCGVPRVEYMDSTYGCIRVYPYIHQRKDIWAIVKSFFIINKVANAFTYWCFPMYCVNVTFHISVINAHVCVIADSYSKSWESAVYSL